MAAMTLSRTIPRSVHCAGRLAPLWIAALALIAPADSPAEQKTTTLERRIKAAFLYKFSGYVEWPAAAFPHPETPVTIGIADDEPLAAELASMVAGRTSAGRPISVVQLDPGDRPERLHILFIAQSEAPRIRSWVESLRGAPVLVVTESERALSEGSMVNFVLSGGRVRFEISVPNAEQNGLRLSSGLLAVAKAVLTRAP
jgi:hypothetical protein